MPASDHAQRRRLRSTATDSAEGVGTLNYEHVTYEVYEDTTGPYSLVASVPLAKPGLLPTSVLALSGDSMVSADSYYGLNLFTRGSAGWALAGSPVAVGSAFCPLDSNQSCGPTQPLPPMALTSDEVLIGLSANDALDENAGEVLTFGVSAGGLTSSSFTPDAPQQLLTAAEVLGQEAYEIPRAAGIGQVLAASGNVAVVGGNATGFYAAMEEDGRRLGTSRALSFRPRCGVRPVTACGAAEGIAVATTPPWAGEGSRWAPTSARRRTFSSSRGSRRAGRESDRVDAPANGYYWSPTIAYDGSTILAASGGSPLQGGSAYFLERGASGWSTTEFALDGLLCDEDFALSLGGDTALAAHLDCRNYGFTTETHVFRRTAGGWQVAASLWPDTDGDPGATLAGVATDGKTTAIAVSHIESPTIVTLFELQNGTWVRTGRVTSNSIYYVVSVAVDGDRVFVSDPTGDVDILERGSGGWTLSPPRSARAPVPCFRRAS